MIENNKSGTWLTQIAEGKRLAEIILSAHNLEIRLHTSAPESLETSGDELVEIALALHEVHDRIDVLGMLQRKWSSQKITIRLDHFLSRTERKGLWILEQVREAESQEERPNTPPLVPYSLLLVPTSFPRVAIEGSAERYLVHVPENTKEQGKERETQHSRNEEEGT